MIHLGKNSYKFNRQIFFIVAWDFYNHGEQNEFYPVRLCGLSLNLWNLQMALEERWLQNNVSPFTMSDFGSTLINNGGSWPPE
jgi:hypothetical protein